MVRIAIGAAVACAMVAAVLAVAAGTGALSLSGDKPPTEFSGPGDVEFSEPLNPGTPLPELTPDEIERATALIFANPLIQSIMMDTELSVDGTGTWTEEEGLVGAVVVLRLSDARDITGSWPYVVHKAPLPRDTPPAVSTFERREMVLSERNVTALRVLVDLRSDEVMEIRPSCCTAPVPTASPSRVPTSEISVPETSTP